MLRLGPLRAVIGLTCLAVLFTACGTQVPMSKIIAASGSPGTGPDPGSASDRQIGEAGGSGEPKLVRIWRSGREHWKSRRKLGR
jgi:hypothetical protein